MPALEEFFGSAAGLSASVITRLTASWQEEQRRFAERDLAGADYVYVWVDGVHFTVRLDEGPRLHTRDRRGASGREEGAGRARRRAPGVGRLVGGPAARLQTPGHARPGLAAGDGALGFWATLREVFTETREQRD